MSSSSENIVAFPPKKMSKDEAGMYVNACSKVCLDSDYARLNCFIATFLEKNPGVSIEEFNEILRQLRRECYEAQEESFERIANTTGLEYYEVVQSYNGTSMYAHFLCYNDHIQWHKDQCQLKQSE